MRIAIIGAGISGLGCAWQLHGRHEITLFEAQDRLGGHSHTVDVPGRDGPLAVDTGFIVYNEPNYPNLVRLFAALGVPTHASDMSFGVSIDGGRFEYSGRSPRGLLAQTGNLASPTFQRLLVDILRFNRDGRRFLAGPAAPDLTLGAFLAEGRYGETFRRGYLLPMGAAIWSASLDGIAAFPAAAFLRFFANHGLLTVNGQPAWRTVTGGSRVYVERLAAPFAHRIRAGVPVAAVRRCGEGVEVVDAHGRRERFDHAVLACHADQALALIERATPAERSVLGAFTYQTNRAVLHRDPGLMPKRRAAWSAWNYLAASTGGEGERVSVTYWMNRLQGLDPECPVFVSLNPLREPATESIAGAFRYDHPQYTRATLEAQARKGEIQGRDRLWFCGAHWGWGFHEDGLASGLEVAAALGCPPSWWQHPAPLARIASAACTMPLPAAARAE